MARYVGDNFCDDENNLEACDYDGGDCCLEHKYELDDDEKKDLKTVWNRFCEECQCKDPGNFQKIPFLSSFIRKSILSAHKTCNYETINDGTCDEINNILECEFDGGDCFLAFDPVCEYQNWYDDGYCDPENNLYQCHWDGGDCCDLEYPIVNVFKIDAMECYRGKINFLGTQH